MLQVCAWSLHGSKTLVSLLGVLVVLGCIVSVGGWGVYGNALVSLDVVTLWVCSSTGSVRGAVVI
jgi:hypothetical protein